MIKLVGRRTLYMAATMFAASLLLFLLFELSPQEVVVNALGPYSTTEQREAWLLANGYDRSAAVRYLDWLARFVTGDWGMSRVLAAPDRKSVV